MTQIGFPKGDFVLGNKMPQRNFTDAEEREVAKLYTVGGFSLRAIARAYGFGHHISFVGALRRQGITQRSPAERNRLYKLNPHVFDEINNEESAYHLGFIYADGCVSRRTLSVSLKDGDKNILIKLRDFLESEHPIMHNVVSSSAQSEKIYGQFCLSVTDRHLANRLRALGITTGRKHFNRCISQVPEHLHKHWFRGLFDGDGSFHSYKPGMSVVGQRKMLEFIRDLLAREVGTNQDIKIYKHPTAKISTLIYMGRPQCQRIAEWLYSDAIIWLERKKAVVDGYPEPQERTRDENGRYQ